MPEFLSTNFRERKAALLFHPVNNRVPDTNGTRLSGGEFDTAGNWTQSGPLDLDGIPDANDIVSFDRGNVTSYPVYFGDLLVPNSDIHPTVARVVIGNNPLSFVGLYGSTLTVDSTNITETARGVVIGSDAGDIAALTSTLATFDTQYATLGSAVGSSGTLNLTSASAGAFSVSGTGATYDLIVGLNGTGAINVTNGRDVTVADDTVLGQNASGVGNVTVSGAGSTWTNSGDFNVGLSGIGSLNVSGGGQISDATGYLASTNGLTSTATISGAGSSWTNSIALIIANHGMGTLEVNGGGQVSSSNSGYVGYFADAVGSAKVTGADSVWTNSMSTIVGSSGEGSLMISAGGLVSDSFGVVGSVAGSVGNATVDGANSRWINSSNLFVGDGGNSTLGIMAGGQVSNLNGFIGDDANSSGEVTVDGMDSTWTNIGDFYVGNAGAATLNILAGGRVNNGRGYVGNLTGSIASAAVDGVGSLWTNSAELYIGNVGDGSLDLTGGGQVTSTIGYIGNQTGSTGEATVAGAGSNWTTTGDLYVGNAGNGTLDITAGGSVTANNSAYVGYASGATGQVAIDGADSEWDNNYPLYVGYSGNGSVDITGGARVLSAANAYLGFLLDSVGVVSVDGMNSDWVHKGNFFGQSANQFHVGYHGDGTLAISGGGGVSVGSPMRGAEVSIGNSPAATGAISIDGSGSFWTVYAFEDIRVDVAVSGQGTLEITNGGAVSVINVGDSSANNLVLQIGRFSGSTGLITVDGIGSTLYMNNLGSATLMIGGGGNAALNVSNGGRVDTTGNISVEAFGMVTSELNINSGGTVTCASGSVGGVNGGVGVVTVANGGVLQATNLTIGANGAVRGDGTIVGSVQNGGLVSPGTSPGALNIDGNYTQTADGELLIELAASSYDQLLVTSDATLAGSLTVNLIDGFTPSIGQMFTILTADDVDGVFGTEPPPTTLNFGFNVIYNAQSVVLTVFSALPGDYNGNGTVDAADYVVWRKTDGTQPGYDTWRTHFGETVGTAGDSPSQAAVPEPATLMVLIFAAAGWSLRRGRPA